jgi:hypothetical protein
MMRRVMAHLWLIGTDASWAPVALDGDAFALGASGLLRVADRTVASRDAPSTVMLRRASADAHATWLMFVPADVRALVNGAPIPLGIVALADRDEIHVRPGSPMFFSTETLAAIVPYPGDGPRGFCPRCKQPIAAGAPAVTCPGCGLWHHASEPACWTYGDRCAACEQLTALDAGFRWTPEEV